MIKISVFQEAKKILASDTAIVMAHGMGWPEDDWQRCHALKAIHGAFLAQFYPTSNAWTQIDELKVQP